MVAEQGEPVEGIGRMTVGLHTVPDAPSHNSLLQFKPASPPPIQAPPRKHTRDPASHWSPSRKVGVGDVFIMTTFMAAACGLGALPFFFIKKLNKVWAAMANAVACGVMLAASFDLLHEAEGYGALPFIMGLIVGCLFIKSMQDWLHDYEDVKFEGFSGANAQKILLFIGIMAAHAVGEGSGVGAPTGALMCFPLPAQDNSDLLSQLSLCCTALRALHNLSSSRAGSRQQSFEVK